jgi:DivIVA protein
VPAPAPRWSPCGRHRLELTYHFGIDSDGRVALTVADGQIAVSDSGIYDRVMNPDEKATTSSANDSNLRRRSEELETELDSYRQREQLLVDTLLSATRHATAIRESARRDAELALRKARIEAAERRDTAELERDRAMAELLRLRQITQRMRSGLSTFLAATVEELRLEGVEDEQVARQNAELELQAALASVLGSDRRTEIQQRVEDNPKGGSPNGLS